MSGASEDDDQADLPCFFAGLGGLAGQDRGRVRERLAAHHVLEEQLPSVEAGRGAGGLVGDQPLRVRDVVGLEREAERQQLRDRQRVERRPRGHVGLRQLERGVLGGERVRREPGVHAVRVGLEGRAALGRNRRHRAHRGAANSERPQLDVARERARAEQLGERAARLPAARIHLEQPILRVQVADHEVGVVLALGEDVRDAERVAQHGGLSLEPRDVHGLGLGPVRERSARQSEQCGECDERNPRLGHGQIPSRSAGKLQ